MPTFRTGGWSPPSRLAASVWLIQCFLQYVAGMPPDVATLYGRRQYYRIFEQHISAVALRILRDGMIHTETPGRRMYEVAEGENAHCARSVQEELSDSLEHCDAEFAVVVGERGLPRHYAHRLSQGGVMLYDRCERLPLRACRRCDPFSPRNRQYAPCGEGCFVHDSAKPNHMTWRSSMVFYLPINVPISPAQSAEPYVFEIQACVGQVLREPFGLDLAECLVGALAPSEVLSGLRGVVIVPVLDAMGYPAVGRCIPNGHVVLHQTKIMRSNGTLVPDLLHIELGIVFGVPANLGLIRGG